jgi:hypothetical protein
LGSSATEARTMSTTMPKLIHQGERSKTAKSELGGILNFMA